jgi:hypothetical protein
VPCSRCFLREDACRERCKTGPAAVQIVPGL